jgi:hypothetical protein
MGIHAPAKHTVHFLISHVLKVRTGHGSN